MIEILLYIIGILFGVLWFSVIILPIFYGIPRTIWFFGKGILRLKASTYYLKTFILWFVIFTLLIIFIQYLSPKTINYLYNSAGFSYGQMTGIFGSLFYAFTAKGRKDLSEDFWERMEKYSNKTST